MKKNKYVKVLIFLSLFVLIGFSSYIIKFSFILFFLSLPVFTVIGIIYVIYRILKKN